MAQQDFVGQSPAKINNIFVVTIVDMTVTVKTPTKVYKGAKGAIGSSQGIPDVTADFTLAVPKTGPEIDLVALSQAVGGFTFSYELGAVKRYALTGCKINSEVLKVVNGNGEVTIAGSLTATERVQTA